MAHFFLRFELSLINFPEQRNILNKTIYFIHSHLIVSFYQPEVLLKLLISIQNEYTMNDKIEIAISYGSPVESLLNPNK